jgi:hypothetical protein
MNPGSPTSIELIDGTPIGGGETYPTKSTVRYEFAADGKRPAFSLIWHDGGNKPARPEELEKETQLTNEGALYIGTKGKMICLPYAKAPPRLLPQEKHDEFGKPKQMIERSADGHHGEWYKACIGERPSDHPKSNFAYAGPFTETILLGCIAQKVGGKLMFDSENLRFTNNTEANGLITKAYRKGWDFRMG